MTPEAYDAAISSGWRAGRTAAQITASINASLPDDSPRATVTAISKRAVRLGLRREDRKVALRVKDVEAYDASIRRHFATAATWPELAELVGADMGQGLSAKAVRTRAFKLGLKASDRAARMGRTRKPSSPHAWSEAAVEAMHKLYDAGLSYRAIARELRGKLDEGRPLSEAMVRGLAERENWRATRPLKQRPPQAVRRAAPAPQLDLRTARKAPVVYKPAPHVANDDGVALLALTASSCRFVIGETVAREARFCGGPCDPNPYARPGQGRYESYCPAHRLRVFGNAVRPEPRGFRARCEAA
jgi:hypothetical protein